MTTPVLSGTQFTVNANPTGIQIEPRVAALSDGRCVIVWYEDDPLGPDPVGTVIRSQIVRADGTPDGPEVVVPTFTDGNQVFADVTALTNGGYVVTWQTSDLTNGDGSGSAIKAQVFDSAGAMVGTEFLVNSLTLFSQTQAVVTVLADGGFAVAFQTAASNDDIAMRLFDADGTPRGAQVAVNELPSVIQRFPEITTLENGNILVVWNQFGGTVPATHDTVQNGVVGRIFTAAGVAVTGNIPINTTTDRHQQDAEAAGLAGGGFVVTWMDDSRASTDNSANAVRAQVFDDLGNKVGAEIVVNTTIGSNQNEPSVTALSDGRFLIAWSDQSDGLGWDIRAQLFDADGTPSGSEFKINAENSLNQVEPSVEELSDGRIMVSWRNDGDVVAQFIDPREAGIRFNGTAADDISVGTRFNDRLSGSKGNDRLFGADRKDTLDGGNGNDRLDGGLGVDALTGGKGADAFVFTDIRDSSNSLADSDRIFDFRQSQGDVIDLSAIDADSTTEGNSAFTFVGSGPFTALGQVRAFQSGADTIVEVNTKGGLGADMQIALSGLHVLVAGDFVL